MSLSDVWASDEEENVANTAVTYDKKIAEREWERMNEIYGNVGYKDGIEEGKENTLQRGFDVGYAEGARFGVEFGRLRGHYIGVLFTGYRSLMNDLSKLTYDDVFTKDYFLLNYNGDTKTLKDRDDIITKDFNVQENSTTKCSCKHLDDKQQKRQLHQNDNFIGCCQGDQEKCENCACCDSEEQSIGGNLDDSVSNLGLGLSSDRETLPSINSSAEKLLLEYRDKVSEILKKLGFNVDLFLER
ncbi:2510_t:CDS:2 [Ambispora gerdemannii]|uniref:Protein YAE1 n=1 Tax=Ambispora gerdemannii TaxID=144530 RepID=A0A9N8Z3Y3_9GLOM|nr:2510_t:CDS:2 [Ambispora gerdemannii]